MDGHETIRGMKRATKAAGKPVHICLKPTQHEIHTSDWLERLQDCKSRLCMDVTAKPYGKETHPWSELWLWLCKAAAYPRQLQPCPICHSNPAGTSWAVCLHTEIWTSTDRAIAHIHNGLARPADRSGQQNSRVSVTNVIVIERRKNKKKTTEGR